MTLNGVIERMGREAASIGSAHGFNAATWYDASNWSAVLRGIEDGDPAILDTFPMADLSGQWADTMTGPALWDEVCNAVGVDSERHGRLYTALADCFSDVCEAYESAFARACNDEIERTARFHAERGQA